MRTYPRNRSRARFCPSTSCSPPATRRASETTPDLIISWWYGDNVWTRARSRWATTPAFAEVAELLAEARSKTSEDEQQPLWNQCFDIIAAEVPLYPLFHRETATAWMTAQLDDYDPISATGLNFLVTTALRDADPI